MKHKLKFFLAAMFLSLSVIVAVPTPAAAANEDFGNIGANLCTIVRAVTGRVGRAIATIAVIFLGFGAFFGKVTWGLAVAVAIGIFAIFGAATIVTQFGGSTSTANCSN
jgi:type IV secretion system protein VirB2